MNTRILSLLAIALWGMTVLGAGLYLVTDHTKPSSDQRREIALAPGERDLVLKEMRGILASLDGILIGLAQHDAKKMEDSARASGMVMATEENAGLIAKLPLDFKQLGLGLHREFDSLADAAKSGESQEQILLRTAKLTNRCNSCHQVYRLGIDPNHP
jgi:cytochrome c556